MSYEDRLIQPAYTPPISKKRHTWKYREQLSTEFQMRFEERRYLGVKGVEYFSLGDDGNDSFPFTCVFDGTDHDKLAVEFLLALREECKPGYPGILEHPTEGTKEVFIPYARKYTDPTNDAAETFIDVEFRLQLTLPQNKKDSPKITTQKQFENVMIASKNDFAQSLKTDTGASTLSAVNSAKNGLNKLYSSVGNVARFASTVSEPIRDARDFLSFTADIAGSSARYSQNALTQFNQIQTDILNDVDTLVKSPAVLASQFQRMIATISNIPGLLADKIQSWKDLYSSTGGTKTEDKNVDDELSNILAFKELMSVSAVANIARQSVIQSSDFRNADDALASFYSTVSTFNEMLQSLDDEAKSFDDLTAQEQYFSQTDSVKNMKVLLHLAGDAIRESIQILPQKTVVQLINDQTIFDVIYQYYGTIDNDTFDRFVEDNNLSLDTLLFLDAGTEVLV